MRHIARSTQCLLTGNHLHWLHVLGPEYMHRLLPSQHLPVCDTESDLCCGSLGLACEIKLQY